MARRRAMGISVVVPTWKGRELLEGLFGSLAEVVFGDDDEMIVVDGGSGDGSKELVEGIGVESSVVVKFVELEKNLGFAGNVNRGLELVRVGNDVVILNNDVVISSPGVFTILQRVAVEHADVGVLSALILDSRGVVAAHGASVLPFSHDGRNWCRGQRWSGQYEGLRLAQYVPFVCVFIKRACLDEVGKLDEGYFAYYEDVDFCLRAEEEGWRTASTTETQVVHLGPGTTSRKELVAGAVYARSKERFEETWGEDLWARWQEKVVWVGELGFATGFGRWCREAVRASLDAGVLGYFQPSRAAVHVEALSPEPRTRDCQGKFGDVDMTQVIIEHADRFSRNSGGYRIGWAMCEVEPWPRGWLEGCRWVDEVWVPTERERKGLLASGVERPVRVMPLGVDPGLFHPGRRPWPQRPAAEFVFVSVFIWCMRKNPDVLISAFREEFGPEEGVALFIKTGTPTDKEKLPYETRWWMKEAGAPVVILADPVRDSEMGRIYTMGDCFVLPTSGEGWCLPAMEALACGLPVITTGWGGMAEWGVDAEGEPLPGMHFLGYEMADAGREIKFFRGSRWAEPSRDDLRGLMREAYERREEWKAEAMEGSRVVRERWTWERVGERIARRLGEIGR